MERLLAELSRSIDGARTLEELARPLLALLQSVTALESAWLGAIDGDTGRERVLFACNGGALALAEGLPAPWDDAPCPVASDPGGAPRENAALRGTDPDPARVPRPHTCISAPVLAADGVPFGTLCAASAGHHPISPDAAHVLRLFSRLIGQCVEREQLDARLRRATAELKVHALADPLTGLPNRRSLHAELARMLARVQRDDRALVVGVIDLDGAKAIEDAHGHEAGERFRVAVARALERALRGGDLVARIGEDAFVAAGTVPRETAAASADVLRDRLAAALRGRFDLGHGRAIDYAGASVGVEIAHPGEVDVEALLARADRAMRAARGARRSVA